MQVEITIRVLGSENETAEQLLGRLSAVLRNQPQILVHDVSEEKPKPKKIAASDEDAPKKGPGRPAGKKKEKEPEPEEEELEEVDDEIEVEEDGDSDEEPEEDEKPKKFDSKKPAKGPTIEGDVIPAFKALTKEYGNGAGAEILRMFKVTSVRDLDDDDIPKVLKAIKSYKPAKKK